MHTLYHRAHQLADGGFAVVHALPGQQHVPLLQLAVAVDVEGFPDWLTASRHAAWMNAERVRDETRWANNAGLRGVRL